jgi:hypothetical protein
MMASALTGQGVKETFMALLQAVYPAMDRQHALKERLGINASTFAEAVMGERNGNPNQGIR